MATQNYRDIAMTITKGAENCVLVGYYDQGGIPTWGWGHTGPGVKVGQMITRDQADFLLEQDYAVADHRLTTELTKPDKFAALDEHEKAALLDFVFNSGGGPSLGEKGCWNLWNDVDAGRLADVPDQFDRFIWVHVNGKAVTSLGLKNRRAAEKTLWNTADVGAAVAAANAGGQTVSSGATRALPTPPQTSAPKTLSKTSLGLKIAGFIAGSGGLASKAFTPDTQAKVQNVADTAAAHASSFGHFGAAIASICGAAVVVVAAGALVVHVSQQEAAKV
jgi:GH24 family phage-related lysozyme (muramidase)